MTRKSRYGRRGGSFGLVVVAGVVVFLLLIVGTGYRIWDEFSLAPEPPVWLVIDPGAELSKPVLRRAILAAVEWNEKFHCDRMVLLTSRVPEAKASGFFNWEVTMESAGAGWIAISPDAGKAQAKSTVLHAMTHACKPDQMTKIQPIPYQEGSSLAHIVAFEGLSLIVRLPNGQENAFRKIEEGLCERNATLLNYKPLNHEGYRRVRQLTLEHFPVDSMIDPNVFIRTNDVRGFTAAFLGKDFATDQDILDLMAAYNDAWKGEGK